MEIFNHLGDCNIWSNGLFTGIYFLDSLNETEIGSLAIDGIGKKDMGMLGERSSPNIPNYFPHPGNP
jgi:hypothetical protein